MRQIHKHLGCKATAKRQRSTATQQATPNIIHKMLCPECKRRNILRLGGVGQ